MTRRERDTARRQFNETRQVNHHNAAAHRATEVAMLRQNNEHQRQLEQLGWRKPAPELRGPVPALKVPEHIPVPDPAALPENINP